MAFQILINGRALDNWTSATVNRSLDENAGRFRFSSSNTVPANYPVRAGDAVRVLINGKPVLTGYCEVLDYTVREGEDTVTVAGRDNTQDLIDSTMPDDVKFIEGPISFKGLCEKVVSTIGANITVTQSVSGINDFDVLDLFLADAGSSCIEYLVSFARKRQVYLIADGAGNLDIFRPPETLPPGHIINREGGRANNAISSAVRFDHSRRYGIYSVRSQDNFGADPRADYDAGVDRKGVVWDTNIRGSRFLEIQAEESMDDATAEARAVEELNIRVSGGLVYTAVVPGTERAPGILWDIGQLTKIDDAFAGLTGIFTIRAVEYTISADEGTRTSITLVPPGSYTARVPDSGDARRAKQGPEFQTP